MALITGTRRHVPRSGSQPPWFSKLIKPKESYFSYAGQEESPVDHDISFRPGLGADGADTYTPRTLIYDLKGAFGTLRRENALYALQQHENPAQTGPWSGSTANLHMPPIAPSPYQQALDQGTEPPALTTGTVRFWSDYNHIFYHPRSIVQLSEYELNSSLMPFERWQTGEELFSNLDREHDLLDRDLRPLLEECDQLQALQIFSSIDDAWGGFTSRYLERISDEMGKGSRWVFGLKDGKQHSRDRQMLQMANLAQSVLGVDTSAATHIPLTSFPRPLPSYVSLDAASQWHTSALQATLLESVTLPTRLRSTDTARATFDQLETTLNNDGKRRILSASMSADDPAQLENELQVGCSRDVRMTNGLPEEDYEVDNEELDISMFPSMSTLPSSSGRRLGRRVHIFGKAECVRGPWEAQVGSNASSDITRDRFTEGPRTATHNTQLLFPVLPSYPRIFDFADRPEKLAIKATVSTSTAVADQIRELERASRRLISVDEREALCDGLFAISDEYEEGWTGDDESDDDD